MKNIKFITIILPSMIFLTACIGSKEYIVESDYSYYGKFKKYKTFNFVNEDELDTLSSYYSNFLKEGIKSRMELQGYTYINKKPNLLISYKIFYNDVKYRGYNQPKMEYWVKNEIYEDDENYDPVKYNLREGTLLVLFFDRKQRTTIWQGYASGVFSNDYEKNQRYIKRALRSIFDQYKLFAEGFWGEDT